MAEQPNGDDRFLLYREHSMDGRTVAMARGKAPTLAAARVAFDVIDADGPSDSDFGTEVIIEQPIPGTSLRLTRNIWVRRPARSWVNWDQVCESHPF